MGGRPAHDELIPSRATTIPAPCALLREAGLQPAHVLHSVGLLRFWRLVLSREPESLLRQTWNAVQSQGTYADPNSVNKARDVLRASAAFLREVYDARWIRGHKHNQRKEGNTDDEAGGGHAAGS